eukprot:TRINITY_DN4217_c0_g2_i13.p1 TRINITY_DN4217_c0_g2~~TRINITY_DN4217_c0_g2_i13.p1  ORF type:complete len:243 (+),score=50.30 TRINITY_DN4217_c0_g2_i13:681-1409(+)
MKFLTSVLSPTTEDTEKLSDFSQKPFISYLQTQLSPNVLKFVLYALAMIDTDQEREPTVTTIEGMARLKQFTTSIGRYGSTPFLAPLYGCGELPQAFCRLSAVYGATYVLKRTAQKLFVEDGKCVAVETNGQVISCENVVASFDHLSQFADISSVSQVSHAIVISTVALIQAEDSTNDLAFMTIPPNSLGNTYTIYVIQTSSSLCVTPPGYYLIHMITLSQATAHQDLELVVDTLFRSLCVV